MSVIAVAVVLGLLLLLLIRVRRITLAGAALAVVFGLVLGTTPAGPQVNAAVKSGGHWMWSEVQAL